MKNQINIIPAETLFELAKTAKKHVIKKGRASILAPHIDTIRYLRKTKHFSYKNIHSFFNDSGVKCTYQNLIVFVRKNKIGAKKNKRTKS